MSPNHIKFIGFGAMDVAKPYEFIGIGAMGVAKPYQFIRFGAMPNNMNLTEISPPAGPRPAGGPMSVFSR